MSRTVVVFERNRVVGNRIGRIVSAAAAFAPFVCGPDLEALKGELPTEPGLLLCDAADVDQALAWTELWPELSVAVWSQAPAAALTRARRDPRLRSVIGWPSFASSPRPLELGLLARRRLVNEPLPSLSALLPTAGHRQWRTATTAARDDAVAEVTALLEATGVTARTAARAGEVAHELLMNAMYVAPITPSGAPRYAFDRKASIQLEAREVPTLALAFDGQLLALEATDPYGGLRDHQLLDGVLRGLANQDGARAEIDAGRGGAGLGLATMYQSAVALVVEVRPGESTRVMWLHDVDIATRDYRGLPASLHLFHSDARPTVRAGVRP